jgi:hypothetical protein
MVCLTVALASFRKSDNLMGVPPPLRSTNSHWSEAVVGAHPDLIPSEKVMKFADILFWIKLHPFPEEDFEKTFLDACEKENVDFKKNLETTKTGKFAISLFVEDVLVSKGKGASPNAAEKEVFQDFVERVLSSDYLIAESKFNDFCKLKLFETEGEVKAAHTTAFRYDLLCRDHNIPQSQLPVCSDCHRIGHNNFFCTTVDQNRYVPVASELPKNSTLYVDSNESRHKSETIRLYYPNQEFPKGWPMVNRKTGTTTLTCAAYLLTQSIVLLSMLVHTSQ